MGYRFYFGASGVGKTYRAFSDIIDEAQKNLEKNFFIIVPEQFTMQTQKDIVQMHPNHAVSNIDVLSFNRLAYRIFEGRTYIFKLGGDYLCMERCIKKKRRA